MNEQINREPWDDAESPAVDVPGSVHGDTAAPGGTAAIPGQAAGGQLPAAAAVRPSAIACPNCHYNLTGARLGMGCPECGMIVGAGLLGVGSNMPTSGKAVAAMVLGILSIIGCMTYGLISIICGPLAIIFARQAKAQSQRGEVSPSSEGMATAGLVTGIIGTIIGGLALLAIGGFIVMAIVASP